MKRGVVQDDDRHSLQADREPLELLEQKLAGHRLRGRFNHRPIVSRKQRESVDALALFSAHNADTLLYFCRST